MVRQREKLGLVRSRIITQLSEMGPEGLGSTLNLRLEYNPRAPRWDIIVLLRVQWTMQNQQAQSSKVGLCLCGQPHLGCRMGGKDGGSMGLRQLIEQISFHDTTEIKMFLYLIRAISVFIPDHVPSLPTIDKHSSQFDVYISHIFFMF